MPVSKSTLVALCIVGSIGLVGCGVDLGSEDPAEVDQERQSLLAGCKGVSCSDSDGTLAAIYKYYWDGLFSHWQSTSPQYPNSVIINNTSGTIWAGCYGNPLGPVSPGGYFFCPKDGPLPSLGIIGLPPAGLEVWLGTTRPSWVRIQ